MPNAETKPTGTRNASFFVRLVCMKCDSYRKGTIKLTINSRGEVMCGGTKLDIWGGYTICDECNIRI